ncbi:hypothetical protein EYF80_054044 [Liparis tanakae]|uniref:Uncharacterized protein n=1 Tax=Liparis tanakae TaxID=230148 RepID=A0A4Z2F4G5_9TELE|nr:hypothetical protein EYF80_054044 [Liparis tanakae]
MQAEEEEDEEQTTCVKGPPHASSPSLGNIHFNVIAAPLWDNCRPHTTTCRRPPGGQTGMIHAAEWRRRPLAGVLIYGVLDETRAR